MDQLTRLYRWVDGHKKIVEIAGIFCFAAISAQWAGFIDIPYLLQIPFWVGVFAGVLRWTLWESAIKPTLRERAGLDPPPLTDRARRRQEARSHRRSPPTE